MLIFKFISIVVTLMQMNHMMNAFQIYILNSKNKIWLFKPYVLVIIFKGMPCGIFHCMGWYNEHML